MEFLSRTFTFTVYYNMVKSVFAKIGFDHYMGLKNKLPPIRYIGDDTNGNELVTLAHPKDFTRTVSYFKNAYNEIINKQTPTVKIENVNNEILEIYPSTDDLKNIPNGFIGLFVNNVGMEIVKNEFNDNEEVSNVEFLPVTDEGIDITKIKMVGVIETFVRKFNIKKHLVEKYKGNYLVVGKMKEINIYTGKSKPTDRYNIIGGKRIVTENCIESTQRETREELGLELESKIYKMISNLLPKTKNIFKFHTFNVYCIHYTPNNLKNCEYYFKSN